MAEEKKTPRHKKMYKDSPHLERDSESGKMAIKKKAPSASQKESDKVQSGTDGMTVHEKTLQELNQKHQKERLEIFHKHEKEYLDVSHKALGEAKAGGTAEADTSKHDAGTGESKIEKIEKDKKE